jgi:hypothetical protein
MQKAYFLAGLFLLSMCGLMLQIIETRIISVIAFYHLAFFAISMAMFGMTGGALFVYLRAKDPPYSPSEELYYAGSAFAFSVLISTLLLISTVVVVGGGSAMMSALLWLKLILILLPPYFFIGVAVTLALTRTPWSIGLIYGVDLTGAAAGCLVGLLLLNLMDAVSALLAIGAIGALAAACFRGACSHALGDKVDFGPLRQLSMPSNPPRIALLIALLSALNALIQPHGLSLSMAHNHIEAEPVAALKWNSFSRIMAGLPRRGPPEMGGPSPSTPYSEIEQMMLNIDGDAFTALYHFEGDFSKLAFLKYDVTNMAYYIRNRGRAAVIGVGGGRDILSAYLFGFRDVTGVELNPIFIDYLEKKFRSFNQLADLPGVRLIADEGRSWFARSSDHFDLIQMSLVDTLAATAAGGLSLSENGLYTVEGWRHFFQHLTPDGVFTVSRWYERTNIGETGRLLSLGIGALLREGIGQPKAHIFVAANDYLATVMIGRAPLTEVDLATLRQTSKRLGFSILVDPAQAQPDVRLSRIVNASSMEALSTISRGGIIDFSAPSDDRPFFFNQLRLDSVAALLQMLRHPHAAEGVAGGVITGNLAASFTLWLLIVLSTLSVLLTVVLPARKSAKHTTRSLKVLGTIYFLFLGLGFMFIEIGLIQRISIFLGHPVYGLAIGLFGMILSTGIGSLLSSRSDLSKSGTIVLWSGALAIYLMLLPHSLSILVGWLESGGILSRAAGAFAAMLPAGILMGFGLPTGIAIARAIDPSPIPWFWAVNGAAGVLAAGLAVFVSIEFSIPVTIWCGAVCYMILAVAALGLIRASRFRPALVGLADELPP